MRWKLYRVGIITARDKGSVGEREDRSGKTIIEIMKKMDTGLKSIKSFLTNKKF